MNRLELLNSELDKLKRFQKIEKHIATRDENYLHSGELSVVNFIDIYIKEKNDNPTLVMISKGLCLSQATVTVLVNRLIDKGLIIKTPSEANKSRKLVSLTEKGMYQLDRRRNEQKERLIELEAILGEKDMDNLTNIVTKINQLYENKLNLDK